MLSGCSVLRGEKKEKSPNVEKLQSLDRIKLFAMKPEEDPSKEAGYNVCYKLHLFILCFLFL